jgi:Rrf2 family protein
MAIGQFFSQRFGYAVHAMAFVARKPAGELTTLPELAEWMRSIWPRSSDSYLSTVVQQLTRAKLLRSQRGIAGGYSLAKAASDITLRDLVELLEGVDQNRCGLSLEDRCPVQTRCSIQRRLRRLEDVYLKALEEVTIDELAQDIVVQIPHRKSE